MERFDKYKEGSDFFLVSEPSSKGANKIGNSLAVINSTEIEGNQFKLVRYHDIFHHFVESGYFYEEYNRITGSELKKENSYSYHGEALIELFNRFFGNLDQDTIIRDGKRYIKLPFNQPGVKAKQPDRIFPINLSYFNIPIDNNYEKQVIAYKTYVIIASLVSGSIFKYYLNSIENTDLDSKYKEKSYYFSQEFKDLVQKFVTTHESCTILDLLDLELKLNWDSSLEITINYCDNVLHYIYEVLFHEVKTEYDDKGIYFELHSSEKMSFFDQLYFTNKSINLVYMSGVEAFEIKEPIDRKLKNTITKQIKFIKKLELVLQKYPENQKLVSKYKTVWSEFVDKFSFYVEKYYGFGNLT